MTTEQGAVRTEIRWSPAWPMLFRAFQLARDPYKIILAAGAVVALSVGWWILGVIFQENNAPSQGLYGTWPADVNRGPNPFTVALDPRQREVLYSPGYWFGAGYEGAPLQIEPFRQFYQPVLNLFRFSEWRTWWYSFLGLLWTLVVWAIAAGGITRIAAVQIARNGEQIGLGEAIGYARRKFFDFFIGPAIPLIVLFVLALIIAVLTEFTQIPYLGIFLQAIIYLFYFLMALVMVAMVVALIGWPLFYATIAAEGSDSLDALSRTLAYVTSRTWSFIKYVIVGLLYSIVVIFIVVFLTSGTVYLVRWSMGLAPGLGWQDTGDPVGSMYVLAPKSYNWRGLLVNRLDEPHPLVRIHNRLNDYLLAGNHLAEFKAGLAAKRPIQDLLPPDVSKRLGFDSSPPNASQYNTLADFYVDRSADDLRKPQSQYDFVWAFMNFGQKAAAGLTAVWLHLIFLALVGFAYSLFWALGTLIYFLLRREVDETEYEEVYIEDEDELMPPITSASTASPPAVTPAPSTPAGSGVPTPEQRPALPPTLPGSPSSNAPTERITPPDRPPGFETTEPPAH